MEKPEKKKNLLTELAKRRAEAKKAGKGIDHFGSSKVSHPEKARPNIPRGGRNGNGKP